MNISKLIKEHPELVERAINACIDLDSSIKAGFYSTEEIRIISEEIKESLKPKKIPVRLDPFAGSPVDCVFGQTDDCTFGVAEFYALGRLSQAPGDGYKNEDGYVYSFCKPRMNYWFSVKLFESKVNCIEFIKKISDLGFEVEQYFLDKHLFPIAFFPIAFEIIGLKDGYCWPWEIDNE